MKTLFIAVVMILSPDFGTPGTQVAQYSYAPSMENCVTEGFSYARKEINKVEYIKNFDVRMLVCMELSEEELSSPEASIEAGKRFLNGMPRKEQ